MKSFEIAINGEDVSLRLIGSLTVDQARDLHTALRSHLTTASELLIDAAQLTRLDAAALQVLIAASRVAAAVMVVARSDAWDEAFRRYALEHTPLQSRPRAN